MFLLFWGAVQQVLCFLSFLMNTHWIILCSFVYACRNTFSFLDVCVFAFCFSVAEMMAFI